MFPASIRALISDELARTPDLLPDGVDLEAYLEKLGEKAEILSDWEGGRYRGLVAFYCNDEATRQAFITLVLVDPRDRRAGIARALVTGVLHRARQRGFVACRLEVAHDNGAAVA